jgi:uncharacterized membrane protein
MDLEYTQLTKIQEEKKKVLAALQIEEKRLNDLKKQTHAIETHNRFLYTGLGFILSAVAIAFYVLYGMVNNPGNQVLAKDSVVFLFAFGILFIAVWIIDQ